MGILAALFRFLHPMHYAKRRIKRAVVPRPIRRAAWIAGGVTHPVSRAKYSVRRGVIRKVDKAITPKRRRPSPNMGGRTALADRLTGDLADGKIPTKPQQIERFVAQHARVPLGRLRRFNRLLAEGDHDQARQVFTNEEILRIADATNEANRKIREWSKSIEDITGILRS